MTVKLRPVQTKSYSHFSNAFVSKRQHLGHLPPGPRWQRFAAIVLRRRDRGISRMTEPSYHSALRGGGGFLSRRQSARARIFLCERSGVTGRMPPKSRLSQNPSPPLPASSPFGGGKANPPGRLRRYNPMPRHRSDGTHGRVGIGQIPCRTRSGNARSATICASIARMRASARTG